MTKPGRIPCINPRCNRTVDAAKYTPGTQIVCHKCWKLLPAVLAARYRQLKKRYRKLIRHHEKRGNASIAQSIELAEKLLDQNWHDIWQYFNQPLKPQGLDNFLEEMNLR